jgi:hypothetical protein
MPTLKSVKIFPPIGIARMGNSQDSYLGPELPFPAVPPSPPGGKYKDNQCRILRQAQRFHLWGYFDTGPSRELTVADGAITWTVHVANAKAVFRGEAAPGALIDPGPRTLNGANDSATFANGTYHHGGQVVEVPLGDASTDSEGRLIVRGGFGFSSSPDGIPLSGYFWDTTGWHDDVSDGPVNATIVVGGQSFQADGAWVICPPPRYAPTTYAPITLYDTMRQAALDLNLSGAPQPAMPPSFVNDIWPILRRGIGMLRVAASDFSPGDHGSLSAVIPPPGPAGTPAMIFSQLANPAGGGGNMPLLNDSGGPLGTDPQDIPPTLRPFQYQQMQAWSQGNYVNDWPPSGQPPAPTTITPDGLTQAALENCIGAPFFPGIEATVTTEVFSPASPQTLPYSEPFRFDQTNMQPGDVTKGMARPWQSDFTDCTGSGGDQPQWWPSARPVSVYPQQGATTPIDWTNGLINSGLDMVDNWFRLGFIVDPGDGLPVQTEFLAVCKDCFIATDRNQIGKEEAQAAVNTNQLITDAFYLIIEGYAPSDFGITTSPPTNPTLGQFQNWFGSTPISLSPPAPAVLQQTTAVPTDLLLEDDSALTSAQRITIGYDIKFTGVNDFNFTGDSETITINATVGSNAIGVSTSSATFDLTKTVAPYMDHGPISYLSDDVRVFPRQVSDGQMFPQFNGPTLNNNDPLGFINALVNALRAAASNPATRQAVYNAFEGLSNTEVGSELEWNSSRNGAPIFNFALCRIRYRATMTPAQNVRVFFRMFQTAATGTDYNSQTTYISGGQPGTIIPLLGVQGGELVTIPFFAQARKVGAGVSLNAQQDTLNYLPTLSPDPTGNEVQAYFGVWLDMNQSQPFYPIQPGSAAGPFPEFTGQQLLSVADLIRGTHQCLVTEISCSGFAIPDGATTASNAMLSQRNLAIDNGENPGATASRRAQHSFAIRPTAGNLAPKQGPDEMMIVWGNTPVGTEATIYLPGVRATEVLALARKNFNLQTLEKVDDHTLRCRTAGVTYLPIPQGSTVDLAGLITLDLPAGIREGQIFRIVVRQVVDRPSAPPSPRATRQFIAAANEAAAASKARYIIGAFQFSVEVKKAPDILRADESTLTVLKRVIATVPIENRWYPVLRRNYDQIMQRFTALGGNPGAIPGPGVTTTATPASTKCRNLSALCSAILAAFVVILGALTGTPRLVAGAVAVLLYALAMAAWTTQCKPSPCRILKSLLMGTALGGGILAILVLFGIPVHLVVVLVVLVVVALLAIIAALNGCW